LELTIHEYGYYINILIKIVIAVVLGFAIGFEREITSKIAGLRTHILVCVGSCVFTILSVMIFPTISADGNPVAYGDPARIAAQILTGIGFIGAGTVLRHGSSVFGLTTAATLWTTASIGMAVGCGSLILAAIATVVTLFVLILVRKLETGFLRQFTQKTAAIKATLIVKSENIPLVIKEISTKLDKIIEINHSKKDETDGKEKLYVVSKVVSQNPVMEMYNKLDDIKNVENVYITNMNFEKYN